MAAHRSHTADPGRLKLRLAAASLAALTAAGVAAGLVRAAACGAEPELPRQVRLSVPYIRQKGDWCGPAALAMVLRFHGRRVSQDEVASGVHVAKGAGALNLDLKLYARRLGFRADSKSGTLADIQRDLAAGRPAICTIKLKRGLHYLPVVGYDEPKKELLVHLRRPFVRIGFDSFERRWKEAGSWMLTIYPPEGGAPREAEPPS